MRRKRLDGVDGKVVKYCIVALESYHSAGYQIWCLIEIWIDYNHTFFYFSMQHVSKSSVNLV